MQIRHLRTQPNNKSQFFNPNYDYSHVINSQSIDRAINDTRRIITIGIPF